MLKVKGKLSPNRSSSFVLVAVLLLVTACGAESPPAQSGQPAPATNTREPPAPSNTPAPTDTPAPTNTPRPPPTATPLPVPPLSLISSSCLIDSIGYVTCKGFVRNDTAQSIRSLQVVVIWYDANDVPQSSDNGYADYNPILSGQSSPWTTISKSNPLLKRYRVSFKLSVGGTLDYTDLRK